MHRRIKQALAMGATAAIGIGATAGSVTADPLPTVILGTPGDDVLPGTRHDDVIIGFRGKDLLVGSRGNDVLEGRRGDDTLRAAFPLGKSGEDIVRGGLGVDRCFGDSSDHFFGCEVVIIRNG